MATGIKEKVTQTLKQTGALSSVDLADLEPPTAPSEPVAANSGPDKVATVAVQDPMLQAGLADSSAAELADQAAELPDTSGYAFNADPLIEIEVSEDDKRAFEDAIVEDGRFVRPFSLFNGKLKGTMRNRTANESRAILNELNRQWVIMSKEGAPASEYSTTLRVALLTCQVASLNGVTYPEMEEPLTAVMRVVDGKQEIKAPKWYADMFTLFGKMGDGKQAALYGELCRFEQKYWTLTRHADDQNFWCPGESTSA